MHRPHLNHQLDAFFCLRTPLLPLSALRAWSEGLAAVDGPVTPLALEPVLAADRTLLRAKLKGWIAKPEIREALRVASPHLVESLARWQEAPESEKGRRTELALVRYFARMCHRSTPFGLFAGHSTGQLGSVTALRLGPPSTYRRRSRLDMGLLCSLVEGLLTDPAFQLRLRYRPNNSLYRCGGRLRYAVASTREGERSYRLAALQEDETLATAF